MKRRAMSLIEVIFTASLLAIVFMVLLSAFPTAMFSVRQTEHRLTASNIAQAILDGCRSGSFSYLKTDQTVDINTVGYLGDLLRHSNQKGDDGTLFNPVLIISASPTAPTLPRTSFCQLQVDVNWQERGQSLHISRILQLSSIQR